MLIRFYATLRTSAQGKEIRLSIPSPGTVRAALTTAARGKPNLERELWDEQGNLRDVIKVFLNGRQTEYLPDGLDTLVSDVDELDVFPPVGGGA